jgi:hypothetical protein
MNLNSALYILYSLTESIIEYKQEITVDSDPLWNMYNSLCDDSVYIDIPDIKEMFIISNIVTNNCNYEVIVDKNILGSIKVVLLKKHKRVSIRLYNLKDYNSFKISFDVTLTKKNRSFL